MLKWVQCIRRRPELSVVEFRQLWLEYGEEIVALGAELGAVRVEVSASLAVEVNVEWQLQRGSAAPFDGIAELWFDSAKAADAAYATEIGKAVAADSLAHVSSRVRMPVEEYEILG